MFWREVNDTKMNKDQIRKGNRATMRSTEEARSRWRE